MRDNDRVRILHNPSHDQRCRGGGAVRCGAEPRRPLDRDRMLLFALVHAIGIFGEAASKLSPETRASAPEIPWSAIVSMRNRLIHGYFDVDMTIV